jgi:hypothetical protein
VLSEGNPLLRDQVVTILAILHGLARTVLNGDMMVLALYDARDTATALGCDPNTVNAVLDAYLRHYRQAREANPLAKFYPEP